MLTVRTRPLQATAPRQRRKRFARHDDVVEHGDPELAARRAELPRDLQVLGRRLGIPGRVVVHEDERGRPQDGLVRPHEIYRLSLPVDMVVVSACQSGLGKEVRGEGLVGLTQAFFHAGTGRVVVSYWRVDDRATAELMERFYRGIFADGLRPAAALRAAQRSMLRDVRWQAPYYWAGFFLQGEWR